MNRSFDSQVVPGEEVLTQQGCSVPACSGSGRYLTVEEAASLLAVCERTIYDALR